MTKAKLVWFKIEKHFQENNFFGKVEKHPNSIIILNNLLFPGFEPFFFLQVFHFYDEVFNKTFQDDFHTPQQNE